ncbi:MAG: Uma2 family endonuclease, partial [Acidobacteria bacterium]|nr:Uma2 family endonuclease [Acidobacteriota bacterium]
MTSTSSRDRGPGPFSSLQIRPGDPYELHDGHPVLCSPQGGQGASSTALGALIILSDPAV